MNSPAGSSPAKTEVSRGEESTTTWPRRAIRYNRRVLRTLVFFSLITSAHANLDNLVNAAQSFAAAIDQQITTDQSDPAPREFAEKTVAYADAKISYYNALRAAMPELTNIAMGREPRPPQVDKFRDAFQPAGEIRETAAEKETAALLKRFSGDSGVQKAAGNSTTLRNSKRLSSKISRGKTLPAAMPTTITARLSLGAKTTKYVSRAAIRLANRQLRASWADTLTRAILLAQNVDF